MCLCSQISYSELYEIEIAIGSMSFIKSCILPLQIDVHFSFLSVYRIIK